MGKAQTVIALIFLVVLITMFVYMLLDIHDMEVNDRIMDQELERVERLYGVKIR